MPIAHTEPLHCDLAKTSLRMPNHVSECVWSQRAELSTHSVFHSSLNVKDSSVGVAPSNSQRHTSAAKLMYEKQYYGLLDMGMMLGLYCFKTCDRPGETSRPAQSCHVARSKNCLLLKVCPYHYRFSKPTFCGRTQRRSET